MSEEIPPFSIPQMRGWFPEHLRPWFFFPLILIYQLSGGVYLAAVAEMVGSLQLRQEDVMYAGFAGLAGMCVVFAIMLRLKLRIAPRVTHLVCCTGIIVCNLITMRAPSLPVLIVVCWVCGIFRMWGTFECNSTIQLWLTPTRYLPVFFCWIEGMVQGNLCLNSIFSSYVLYFSKWEYLHWGMIMLLLLVMLAVLVCMNGGKYTPFVRLYGIDWFGAVTWSFTLMTVTYIFVYGDYYDWFSAWQIRSAAATAAILIIYNVWRAGRVRHPWYPNNIWGHSSVWAACLLIVWNNILISPEHALEHALCEGVLGYDILHTASLQWAVFTGVVVAAVFTLYTFVRRNWSYRRMGAIAFSFITAYLVIMYFTVDYNLDKMALVLPLFCRGFGHTIIGILLLSALTRVAFPFFFQSLSVQNSFSAVLGGAIGSAFITRFLKVRMLVNGELLEMGVDDVNVAATHINSGALYGMVQQQALMVSMKEIYGILTVCSIFTLILIAAYHSNIRLKYVYRPLQNAYHQFYKRLPLRHSTEP